MTNMQMNASTASTPAMNTVRATWLLIRLNPRLFTLVFLLFLIEGLFPVLLGIVMGWFFDFLAGSPAVNLGFGTLIILLVITEVSRVVIVFTAFFLEFQLGFFLGVLMRKNMLARILELPGAQALVAPAGEMISRFSGDQTIVGGLATSVAITMMGVGSIGVGVPLLFHIEPWLTLLALVPMLISIVLINLIRRHIDHYRLSARQAEGAVTNFVGEIFHAVQAIKVASAEESVESQFRRINADRQQAAIKDSLLLRMLSVVMGSTSDVALGLILLLMGQRLALGTFTLGDFVLFAAVLPSVSSGINRLSFLIAKHKQAAVSLRRLTDVLQGAPTERLMEPGPAYLTNKKEIPRIRQIPKTTVDRLDTLRVRGLSYLYPDTQRGVTNVNMTLRPGTLTVVTGKDRCWQNHLVARLIGVSASDWRGYLEWRTGR